jgi:altronate dehydratase small subunit
MKKFAVVANNTDNVATAVKDLQKEQEVLIDVDGKEVMVKLVNAIAFGHKFALKDINKGEEIIKYGEVIGKATKPIAKGEHVHVHNVESSRGRGDWEVDG